MAASVEKAESNEVVSGAEPVGDVGQEPQLGVHAFGQPFVEDGGRTADIALHGEPRVGNTCWWEWVGAYAAHLVAFRPMFLEAGSRSAERSAEAGEAVSSWSGHGQIRPASAVMSLSS